MAELELPADVRLTPQRRAVIDAVERQRGSFTVVQVYDRARRREPTLGARCRSDARNPAP